MLPEHCQDFLLLGLLKQQTVTCSPLRVITTEINILCVGSE
jgi:hypothetical protein